MSLVPKGKEERNVAFGLKFLRHVHVVPEQTAKSTVTNQGRVGSKVIMKSSIRTDFWIVLHLLTREGLLVFDPSLTDWRHGCI